MTAIPVVLFLPDVPDIYPDGHTHSTVVDVPELANILDGEFRPGHFRGVATVVVKLLNIVGPDVALFGQFAVRTSQQNSGIGSTLISIVERRGAEKELNELALDTSERALDLIAFYARRGFRFVEYIQWPDVNYRSVILAKRLGDRT